MPKKGLIALLPGLLEQVDVVAQVEQRNCSDLIRELARRYIQEFKQRQSTHITVIATGRQKITLLGAFAE